MVDNGGLSMHACDITNVSKPSYLNQKLKLKRLVTMWCCPSLDEPIN